MDRREHFKFRATNFALSPDVDVVRLVAIAIVSSIGDHARAHPRRPQ